MRPTWRDRSGKFQPPAVISSLVHATFERLSAPTDRQRCAVPGRTRSAHAHEWSTYETVAAITAAGLVARCLSTVGWLGFYTASSGDIESRTGYARLSRAWHLRQSWCLVQYSRLGRHLVVEREQRHLEHDRAPGRHERRASGSGFYHYADPSCSGCGYGPYLVGMHRAGSTNYNLARRFDSTVYSFLQAYSSDY